MDSHYRASYPLLFRFSRICHLGHLCAHLFIVLSLYLDQLLPSFFWGHVRICHIRLQLFYRGPSRSIDTPFLFCVKTTDRTIKTVVKKVNPAVSGAPFAIPSI